MKMSHTNNTIRNIASLVQKKKSTALKGPNKIVIDAIWAFMIISFIYIYIYIYMHLRKPF